MAWHCEYSYKCPRCGEPYISYAPGVKCPKCGEAAGEGYDIIGEALKGAWFHLEYHGRVLPPDYAVSSLADHYLRLSFLALEAFLEEGSQDVEVVAGAIMRRIDFRDHEYLRPHLEGYFPLLLRRFQEGSAPTGKGDQGPFP